MQVGKLRFTDRLSCHSLNPASLIAMADAVVIGLVVLAGLYLDGAEPHARQERGGTSE